MQCPAQQYRACFVVRIFPLISFVFSFPFRDHRVGGSSNIWELVSSRVQGFGAETTGYESCVPTLPSFPFRVIDSLLFQASSGGSVLENFLFWASYGASVWEGSVILAD